MGKFNIQRARGTLPGRATQVRANIDVRTGGQQIAQAVAGLGGAVADLGLKWDLMEASTQLNEARMKAKQEHNRLMLELPGLEPPEHAKAYEDSLKVQQGFTPKNKRAAVSYGQLLNDFAPQQDLNVADATKAKLKDNKRAIGFVLQQEAIRTGQFKDYFTNLEQDKLMGVYSAEDVVKFKQATIDARERYIITQTIKNKKLAEEQSREGKLSLYKKEDAGETLTRDDFNAVYRDPDEADQYYDEYIAGQRAELAGEANFVKDGNSIVLSKVEAVIDLNPMAVTEEEIYANATNGIGTKNITRLIDRLRKAKAGIYTKIDKYNTQFSTLLNAGYFGDKDKLETSTRFLDIKRRMKEYLDTQKPTEAIADAFFGGLITKDFEVKGWFIAAGGGWDEKGFKHEYTNEKGDKITGFFRYGDIRTRKVGEKVIEEFYAGTDEEGRARWIPRR